MAYHLPISQILAVFRQEVAFMKVSADYRMFALDALRGKWKTAVLTGIAASALGATIVSSSNSAVSNSNQAKDIHFELFSQPNGGRLLAVLLAGIVLWAVLQLIVGGAVQLGYAHFNLNLVDGNDAAISDLFSQKDRLWDGFCMKFLQGLYIALWSLLLVIPGISKWEKGYTTPSIYQLVAICYALNIKEGPSYFTKNFQKPALLNDIGQKKVAEYEMDLIASRRYQPDAEEPAEIDYIMMPVSELPVSAGLGAFLEGEMFQQIQVPASSVPAGAEFGIYVSGDSMEPRYHNGQIVWVKRCEELECGDIGIFVYDDCGYLKKYDEHTPDKSQAEFLTDSYGVVHNQPVLVSLNTKYSPILISPEQRFEVVGKVLN